MLTQYQRERRDQIIAEIRGSVHGIGELLLEAKRDSLYADHGTFKNFVSVEFGMSERQAYYLIDCREVQKRLKCVSVSVEPTKQRSLMVLAQVPEEKQREVWAAAVDMANMNGGSKVEPTEKIVRQAAREYLPEPKPKPKKKVDGELQDSSGEVIAKPAAKAAEPPPLSELPPADPEPIELAIVDEATPEAEPEATVELPPEPHSSAPIADIAAAYEWLRSTFSDEDILRLQGFIARDYPAAQPQVEYEDVDSDFALGFDPRIYPIPGRWGKSEELVKAWQDWCDYREERGKPLTEEECEEHAKLVSRKTNPERCAACIYGAIDKDKLVPMKSPPAAAGAAGFVAPTEKMIEDYKAEKGLAKLDVSKFFNHYSSNGWMVGRNKMACWKSAARNWNSQSDRFAGNGSGGARGGSKRHQFVDKEDINEENRFPKFLSKA